MSIKRDTYTLIRDGQRLLWYTDRLWQLSATLPVQEVALADIPEFQQNCWFQSRPPTLEEVSSHAQRIFTADLKFPVILNDAGGLMDGGHRLCKAHLQGQTHVQAVQFLELPEPDEIVPGDFVDLRTDRLRIREFNAHDLEALFQLYQLPETSEFESWDPHENREQSRDLLQYFMDQSYQKPRREYVLAVEFEDQLIGLCGLDLGFGTETDDSRVGFLSYRLHPEYWGQNFATEAAKALMQFGFAKLGLHRVYAGCSANNGASVRVLEKLDMQHEGTTRQSFPVGTDWHDYKLFGRLKDD
ncbi:MAG: GNAT family N-acetyltransferase [Pseudomonadales bacterium]